MSVCRSAKGLFGELFRTLLDRHFLDHVPLERLAQLSNANVDPGADVGLNTPSIAIWRPTFTIWFACISAIAVARPCAPPPPMFAVVCSLARLMTSSKPVPLKPTGESDPASHSPQLTSPSLFASFSS